MSHAIFNANSNNDANLPGSVELWPKVDSSLAARFLKLLGIYVELSCFDRLQR